MTDEQIDLLLEAYRLDQILECGLGWAVWVIAVREREHKDYQALGLRGANEHV